MLDAKVADAERAIAALGELPIVASTTQLGDRVHVLLARDAPPADRAADEVSRFLADRGLAGVRAEPSDANLEDVFVALLLGEKLDGALDAPHDGSPEAA